MIANPTPNRYLIGALLLFALFEPVEAADPLMGMSEGRVHPELFIKLSRGDIADGQLASDLVKVVERELGRAADAEQRRQLTWALYLLSGRPSVRVQALTQAWQGATFRDAIAAFFPSAVDLDPISPTTFARELEALVRDGSALLAESVATAPTEELIALLIAVQTAAAPRRPSTVAE